MKTIELLDHVYRLKDIVKAQKITGAGRYFIQLTLDTVNGKYNEMISYEDYTNGLGNTKIDEDYKRLLKALEVKDDPEDFRINPIEVLMAEDLKELNENFKNFSVVDIIDYYHKEMESMLR